MTETRPLVPRAPRTQRIRTADDLRHITFDDGIASLEIPWEIVRQLPLKNHEREGGPRLESLVEAIRCDGFLPFDPIIVRIGRAGRWVVVDGGHRLTAAERIAGEFWPNLWGPKVRNLNFLVFTTPLSWTKLREVAREMKAEAPTPISELPSDGLLPPEALMPAEIPEDPAAPPVTPPSRSGP